MASGLWTAAGCGRRELIAYVTTVAIRSGVGGIFFGGFRDSGAGDDAGLGMEGAY